MIYNEHSKQLLASERKKYIIILFTDKTGLRGTARHWSRRTQDPKGPISLALGSWRWGGGYGWGRDGDWEWKGGGWRIFYRRPVPTSITLAFFKSMCSAHSPCGIKRPTISRFWSFKKIKKTYKGCFLSIMVNKFRIFIKNLRNTYGLHFTNS